MPPSSPDRRYGGWRNGDPVGSRQFAQLGALSLDSGAHLPVISVAFETYGRPRRGADGAITNAVLVLHALTGDAHVAGPSGSGQPTAGWWDDMVGPGRALDTERWFVLSSNVLGGCQGTTGPSSVAPDGRVWGSRFPTVTIRDQVRAEALLADHLGIRRFAAVLGGSMGGMRALEWSVMLSERVGSALILATGAAATADQIGTQSAQLAAIRADPGWRGGDFDRLGSGPAIGLGIARQIAHLTYRSDVELDVRFGRRRETDLDPLQGGTYAVQSYLDHHADKLAHRFDAGSYVTLTEAMNHHDVGRGRGGVAAALAAVTAPTVVAGISTDRLYPLRLQEELAELIPTATALRVVESTAGHDGFLTETAAVSALVLETLAQATTTSPSSAGVASNSLLGSTRTV